MLRARRGSRVVILPALEGTYLAGCDRPRYITFLNMETGRFNLEEERAATELIAN